MRGYAGFGYFRKLDYVKVAGMDSAGSWETQRRPSDDVTKSRGCNRCACYAFVVVTATVLLALVVAIATLEVIYYTRDDHPAEVYDKSLAHQEDEARDMFNINGIALDPIHIPEAEEEMFTTTASPMEEFTTDSSVFVTERKKLQNTLLYLIVTLFLTCLVLIICCLMFSRGVWHRWCTKKRRRAYCPCCFKKKRVRSGRTTGHSHVHAPRRSNVSQRIVEVSSPIQLADIHMLQTTIPVLGSETVLQNDGYDNVALDISSEGGEENSQTHKPPPYNEAVTLPTSNKQKLSPRSPHSHSMTSLPTYQDCIGTGNSLP